MSAAHQHTNDHRCVSCASESSLSPLRCSYASSCMGSKVASHGLRQCVLPGSASASRLWVEARFLSFSGCLCRREEQLLSPFTLAVRLFVAVSGNTAYSLRASFCRACCVFFVFFHCWERHLTLVARFLLSSVLCFFLFSFLVCDVCTDKTHFEVSRKKQSIQNLSISEQGVQN